MRYTELFKDRDQIIETQVLQIFPPDQQDQYRSAIRKAIENGGKIWEEKFLPSAWGDKKATEIKHALDKQAI